MIEDGDAQGQGAIENKTNADGNGTDGGEEEKKNKAEEENKKKAEEAEQKKKEIQKAQEAEEKRTHKTYPLERCRVFLSAVPRTLGELHICLSEFNVKVVRDAVPQNFIKEFKAKILSHHSELTAKRDTMEKSACKDARLFRRRCPDDFLDSAEKELIESGKTLKAWKHLTHLYLNSTPAKGKERNQEG